MDNSFVSQDNINSIYDNINVYFVKNHNYNLDNEGKYKRIIKKLTKTIFKKIKNNDDYINMQHNQFHDLVLNKSISVLLNDINMKNYNSSIDIKSSNSSLNESIILGKNKSQDISMLKNRKSKKIKFNNNFNTTDIFNANNDNDNNDITEHFSDNIDDFNKQIKEANKKIKDNFNKIIESNKEVFKSNLLNTNTNEELEIKSFKTNQNVFEEILEDKLNESYKEESLVDSYNNIKLKDIISSVIFKQTDNSQGNKLESYDGEEYLPNLIETIGDQAPVQPLIYQNTGTGTERIDIKVITIDSGGVTGDNKLNTVGNFGTKGWYKFKVDLQDNVKIDKLCDVYLRNISVIGITTNLYCNYLVIDIEEFNIRNYSNNISMRNKIIISNTNTSDNTLTSGTGAGEVKEGGILNINYTNEENYITTINPSKLSQLTIFITNQDGENCETADQKTFYLGGSSKNRIIFELEFKSRRERDDLIIETND